MKYFFLISIVLTIAACSKNGDCFNAQYGDPFVAQAEEDYCFSDGAEMTVDSIINAFCPCEAVCVWEGQMEVYMTWTIDGVSYPYKHNSEAVDQDTLLSLPIDISITSDNIVFAEPCILENPSPEIIMTDLIVNRN
jgi:hypothetical protein